LCVIEALLKGKPELTEIIMDWAHLALHVEQYHSSINATVSDPDTVSGNNLL
jgi:hypothetical protein